jgi:hypothetical protein
MFCALSVIQVKNPKENTTLLNYYDQWNPSKKKKKKIDVYIISGLIWWSAAGARPPRAIKRTPMKRHFAISIMNS